VAVDAFRNVIIADTYNGRVRKVDMITMNIVLLQEGLGRVDYLLGVYFRNDFL
jgi:hypothetical protein